jgi:hypothetical protein
MLGCHASRVSGDVPMLFGGNGGGSASCSPVQPRRSRRRSRLPLHVGRLRTDVHAARQPCRGDLQRVWGRRFAWRTAGAWPLAKIALARHSKHSWLQAVQQRNSDSVRGESTKTCTKFARSAGIFGPPLLGLEDVEQVAASGEAGKDESARESRTARAHKRRTNRGALPAHLPWIFFMDSRYTETIRACLVPNCQRKASIQSVESTRMLAARNSAVASPAGVAVAIE